MQVTDSTFLTIKTIAIYYFPAKYYYCTCGSETKTPIRRRRVHPKQTQTQANITG